MRDVSGTLFAFALWIVFIGWIQLVSCKAQSCYTVTATDGQLALVIRGGCEKEDNKFKTFSTETAWWLASSRKVAAGLGRYSGVGNRCFFFFLKQTNKQIYEALYMTLPGNVFLCFHRYLLYFSQGVGSPGWRPYKQDGGDLHTI